MATRRRIRFVGITVAVLGVALLGLVTADALTLESFFAAAVVCFLAVTRATTPYGARPRWRRRLQWYLALGAVGFVVLAVRRLLAVLPEGLA